MAGYDYGTVTLVANGDQIEGSQDYQVWSTAVDSTAFRVNGDSVAVLNGTGVVSSGIAVNWMGWGLPVAEAPPAPTKEELQVQFRAIAKKLGPERCEQMLVAFGPTGRSTWTHCALGMACGAGALRRRAAQEGGYLAAAASLLGITVEEATLVSHLHSYFCAYRDCGGTYDQSEWLIKALQAEAVKAQPRLYKKITAIVSSLVGFITLIPSIFSQ